MRKLFEKHSRLIGIDYLAFSYFAFLVVLVISIIFFYTLFASIISTSKYSINPLTLFIFALIFILIIFVFKYLNRIKLIEDIKNNGIKDKGMIVSYKNWPRDQLICLINIGSIKMNVEIIFHVTRKNKKRLLEYCSADQEISVVYMIQKRIKCIFIDLYR